MKTEKLRINELSSDGFAWYRAYLTALDTKDVESYAGFLADDVELVMNNADAVHGRDAVSAGLATYWQSFGTIEHDLTNIYGSDEHFVLEALNHYTTADGRNVTLRAVAFTDRNDKGLANSVRLYTETSPLFQ